MMSTKTEHVVDRKGWSKGPWDGEPDKLNWTTATGLPGMIVRNGFGALCGYVAVDAAHPCYRVEYNKPVPSTFEGPPEEYSYGDTPEGFFDVHGGLTYSNACAGHICHVPEPGKPDDVWWFGFDCNHCFDMAPKYARGPDRDDGTYRDVSYVRAEVEKLAVQLAGYGR